MRAFMTNGTWDFLQKIADKHQQYRFFFMNSDSSTLAYYETNLNSKKSVFAAGRAYEIVVKNGEIEEEGFFVMNNIPLTAEGIPVFENRYKNKHNQMDDVSGCIAFRLLRPMKGNIYVIFTQWASKDDYESWKESEQYTETNEFQAIKPPAYFSSRPFVTYYSLFYEEEEEDCEKSEGSKEKETD